MNILILEIHLRKENGMKIDKSKLEALASLPDDKLWEAISSIAGTHGVNLPQRMPSSAELAKLRCALTELDRMSMIDALKIVNKYKRGS